MAVVVFRRVVLMSHGRTWGKINRFLEIFRGRLGVAVKKIGATQFPGDQRLIGGASALKEVARDVPVPCVQMRRANHIVDGEAVDRFFPGSFPQDAFIGFAAKQGCEVASRREAVSQAYVTPEYQVEKAGSPGCARLLAGGEMDRRGSDEREFDQAQNGKRRERGLIPGKPRWEAQ